MGGWAIRRYDIGDIAGRRVAADLRPREGAERSVNHGWIPSARRNAMNDRKARGDRAVESTGYAGTC